MDHSEYFCYATDPSDGRHVILYEDDIRLIEDALVEFLHLSPDGQDAFDYPIAVEKANEQKTNW